MAISNKKKAVAVAAILAGSIGLVSIGSSAVFTDTVTATSSVKTGTAKLRIEDYNGWTITPGTDGHKATLPQQVFFDKSTMTYRTPIITVHNDGDIDLPFEATVTPTGIEGLTARMERVGGSAGDGQPHVPAQGYVQYQVVLSATDLSNDVSGQTANVVFSLTGTA
ncbi:hypothetical protein [Streptomyces sp. NPDC091209]|uniref:hypothetical protein n=1 Tax=Streptomyces sp. NPDC091209 TaxID=3365974 RepID=UPI00382252E8